MPLEGISDTSTEIARPGSIGLIVGKNLDKIEDAEELSLQYNHSERVENFIVLGVDLIFGHLQEAPKNTFDKATSFVREIIR